MLFIRLSSFIFVHRAFCRSVFSTLLSPFHHLSLCLFSSRTCAITSVSFISLIFSLLMLPLLLYPNLLLFGRRFSITFTLLLHSLWLIRRLISPHCHSFLIPFLSHTLNCPLSLLLATSLVFFSALLAPLSSPCLEFRLLIYTLVSCIHHFPLSLPLSRPVFSCFPLFSMCSLLRWNSSVYCIFFSFLYLFPTLSLRAPFDPR